MSCWWADHSQPGLASPETSSAAQQSVGIEVLGPSLERTRRFSINTDTLESCTGFDWDGGEVLHSSPAQYGGALWICG